MHATDFVLLRYFAAIFNIPGRTRPARPIPVDASVTTLAVLLETHDLKRKWMPLKRALSGRGILTLHHRAGKPLRTKWREENRFGKTVYFFRRIRAMYPNLERLFLLAHGDAGRDAVRVVSTNALDGLLVRVATVDTDYRRVDAEMSHVPFISRTSSSRPIPHIEAYSCVARDPLDAEELMAFCELATVENERPLWHDNPQQTWQFGTHSRFRQYTPPIKTPNDERVNAAAE